MECGDLFHIDSDEECSFYEGIITEINKDFYIAFCIDGNSETTTIAIAKEVFEKSARSLSAEEVSCLRNKLARVQLKEELKKLINSI